MGRNVRVTDRQTFTDEALAGDLSLAQVAAEEVGPFIFINMDRSPVPIQDYLKGILPTLQSYDIGGMQLVKDVKVPVDANWKIAMNAFQETYHTHAQHPQVMLSTDEFHVQYDFYPSGHSRMITPQGLVSPRQNFREQMNDDIGAMLSAAGVDPADVQNAHDARPAMQRRKRSLGATGGVDYSRFTDTQLTDIYSGQIFPNTTFSAQPEGLLWTRYMPHATDPEKCIMHVLILARGKMPPRMAGLKGTGEPTSRVPRETVVAGSTGTYEVLEQDLDAIPLVQLGVRSASLPFIRFSEQEGRLQHFYAEIDSYLKRGEEADSATHHGAVP